VQKFNIIKLSKYYNYLYYIYYITLLGKVIIYIVLNDV